MTVKKRVVLGIATLAAGLFAGQANAAVLFADEFTYPDGPLVGAAGSTWVNHSGTAGQVNVVSNEAHLTESESEDVSAALSGGPYTTGTLYGGADFNFSALPSGTGAYFFHFKDSGTGFRARVFATTTGAAPGLYRIGITNVGTTPVTIPVDLALGTSHQLVVAYDAAAAASTLYLDSPTETGGTAATDATTSLPITAVAMRQSLASGSGMGTVDLDNVYVGTSYDEALVVPEPTMLGLAGLGLLALRRRRTM